MKTNSNQASFRQKNPQAIINSLLAYLCTYDSYYPWYQYIANTYDNSITNFESQRYGEEHYFDRLTNLIRDSKVIEIPVYYNTDNEYFRFIDFGDIPNADIQYAEANHATYKAYGLTFYLFKD